MIDNVFPGKLFQLMLAEGKTNTKQAHWISVYLIKRLKNTP